MNHLAKVGVAGSDPVVRSRHRRRSEPVSAAPAVDLGYARPAPVPRWTTAVWRPGWSGYMEQETAGERGSQG
jgi:hypothetical protein